MTWTRTIPAVALGGALGALARQAVQLALPWQGGFPWALLLINVVGAAALAALPALAAVRRRPLLTLFLGTGVLGGFTTMSSFAEQTRMLLADGRPGLAAGYVAASVGGALAAVLVVQRFSTPTDRDLVDDEGGLE